MDITIRNLDEMAYRELKAHAALTGKTIAEVLTDAIRAYLSRPGGTTKRGSLKDLVPKLYPPGNERLSLEIDEIAYGS